MSKKTLKLKKLIVRLSKYGILILLSYQLLYPILYMISMAIRQPIDAYDPSIVWIPKNFSFSSFVEAFKAMNYLSALGNSLTIGFGCAVLSVISCALAGYGFARFKFPGKNILFACVIFTLLVPTQTIILPSYLNMRYFDLGGILSVFSKLFGTPSQINMIGTYWTFFLPSSLGAGIRSGLYIYIFKQFFESMTSSLEEAAYVDGSGPLKTFFYIMLPNAKNAMISVFLFSFVWHFNDYYMSKQFLGTQRKTLVVALSTLRVDLASHVGGQTISSSISVITRIQAGCLLTIIPLFLLFLFTQKYFTDSIEHIGIK